MDITDILNGSVSIASIDEQTAVLDQMRELKMFDLDQNQRENLLNFLCEKTDTDLYILCVG